MYEGLDENGILRSTLCATYEGYLSIAIGTGNVYIRFHSDGSNNHQQGFHATYRISGRSSVDWDNP